MKKINFRYILFGFIVVAIAAINFFNISLTSLPTTFSNLLVKELPELDYDRIESLSIEKVYSDPDDFLIIKDKDEMQSILTNLLNNDLRIYNGGRLELDDREYDLYINFYGCFSRYIIAEEYIISGEGELYKVLDDENDVFEYIETLYKGKLASTS